MVHTSVEAFFKQEEKNRMQFARDVWKAGREQQNAQLNEKGEVMII